MGAVCAFVLTAEAVREPAIRDRDQPHIHQEERNATVGITYSLAARGATGPADTGPTAGPGAPAPDGRAGYSGRQGSSSGPMVYVGSAGFTGYTGYHGAGVTAHRALGTADKPPAIPIFHATGASQE